MREQAQTQAKDGTPKDGTNGGALGETAARANSETACDVPRAPSRSAQAHFFKTGA